MFFDPFSALSLLSLDFSISPKPRAVIRWFSTRTRSPFRTFRENELLGPSLISKNRISPSPWLPSARMGGLVLGPGPGLSWPRANSRRAGRHLQVPLPLPLST